MLDDAGTSASGTPGAGPRAPLGHLSRLELALRKAEHVDEVARSVLIDLVSLPGVSRVGLALSEGAGRRLRFVATDSVGEPELSWCHIDAYDDVPLTTVTRTGEPVLGNLDQLESRYPDVVAQQRENGSVALGAWPLPGVVSPLGGVLVSFDAHQSFPELQRRLFEAAARRTAEAVRRVRTAAGRDPGDDRDLVEPVGSGLWASLVLAGDPRSAGLARRFLRERLVEWQVDEDTVETAQLCLSELVTNVIMHARTDSELTVHLDERVLTVAVRDLGGSGDPAADPEAVEEDPLRVFGRGLMLVDALADRWGSERDASGTTAWFTLELDQESAQTG